MVKKPPSLTISQEGEVLRPKSEIHLPVPLSEWRRLMDRIRRCAEPSQDYVSRGWGLIGVGSGALLGAIALLLTGTFSDVVNDVEVIRWPTLVTTVAMLAGGVAAIVCGRNNLKFNAMEQHHRKEIAEIIVGDMEVYSDRFVNEQLIGGGDQTTIPQAG